MNGGAGWTAVHGVTKSWKQLSDWTCSTAKCLSSSCHNKIPQTEWLTQHTFIFSQFWRLKRQDQGMGKFDFWWSLSSWLLGSCLLSVSSHGFLLCLWTDRERSLVSLPFLTKTPTSWFQFLKTEVLVASQYCVSFRHTAKWFRVRILFYDLFFFLAERHVGS